MVSGSAVGKGDLSLELGILALVLCCIGTMLVYTFVTGISPVPTSPRVRVTVLRTLPTELDGPVFELGSGWGTLAFPLARRYPTEEVNAYELSPVPWLFSQARHLLSDTPNLHIHLSNFHRTSLEEAAAVVCYLYPGGMMRLRPKFEEELPPGAIVVSNSFPVPGWEPTAIHRADDLDHSRVYVYRIPQSLPSCSPDDGGGVDPISAQIRIELRE